MPLCFLRLIGVLYQQLLGKYKNQWTTLVKHLHGISPTGHIAHRNNPHAPHTCPACSCPQEDNNHVLTCQHPSHLPWRNTTIHRITIYEPGDSDPYLIDILRDGISRVHRQLEPINPRHYPDMYRQELITQQNKIGWDHLYRGRWSSEWSILQHQYTVRRNNDQQTSASKAHCLDDRSRSPTDQAMVLVVAISY